MSQRSAEESGLFAGVPLLLECDRRGQVLWLSGRARSVVGAPDNLAEVLAARRKEPHSSVRLFEVLESPEGLLVALQMEPRTGGPEAIALRQLELKFLNRYFHLQSVERHLSTRASRKRRGGGRVAIRQIELERQRIGRDLHTGVGQMLAAIRLQLEFIKAQLSSPPESVREALDNIGTLASGALDQIRAISRRVHPPEWQRLTIDAALRQLWELSGIPLEFDAELRLPPIEREPDPEVKVLIYRTAQEGLSNIIHHSKATRVAMSLQQSGEHLILTLEDNGVGFDPAAQGRQPASASRGIGLRSISEQAAALGAKIQVESGPNGTKLLLSTLFSGES